MSTILNVKEHGVLHQYSAGPAFSSNLRSKKPIAHLEIVSEATAEETDVESMLSGLATGSMCTSPTCTRESSSDESAQLLVQPFDSSQYSVAYGNEAKERRYSTLQVQQISHNIVPQKTDKPRTKVSFQGEFGSSAPAVTEISSKRLHKQLQSFSAITEAASSSANRKETDFVKVAYKARETSSSAAYKKSRSETDVQPSESALNLHPPGVSHRCFPLPSGRSVADLLRKSSSSLCKLQGTICRLWQRSLESEDDEDLSQVHLPDTNMNDVNEMKALLNTINNNLKMLETRSRAHPQLLSSKLAPVYFTT